MENTPAKKVLILDDDQAILDVLKQALTDNEYEVKTLGSTEDIIDEIEIYQPEVVLLDYLLPRINGGELCHQIKSNRLTRHLSVILCSAYPRVLYSLQEDYGCDAFLEKPFDLSTLLDTIGYFSGKVIGERYQGGR